MRMPMERELLSIPLLFIFILFSDDLIFYISLLIKTRMTRISNDPQQLNPSSASSSFISHWLLLSMLLNDGDVFDKLFIYQYAHEVLKICTKILFQAKFFVIFITTLFLITFLFLLILL